MSSPAHVCSDLDHDVFPKTNLGYEAVEFDEPEEYETVFDEAEGGVVGKVTALSNKVEG